MELIPESCYNPVRQSCHKVTSHYGRTGKSLPRHVSRKFKKRRSVSSVNGKTLDLFTAKQFKEWITRKGKDE